MKAQNNMANNSHHIRRRNSLKRIGHSRRNNRTSMRLFQAVKDRNESLVRSLCINTSAANKELRRNVTFLGLLIANGRCGNVNITRSLIRAGARINACTIARKNTALHFAVSYGHLDVACELIRSGANICAENEVNSTPLHAAIVTTTRIDRLVDTLARSFRVLNSLVPEGHLSLLTACWSRTSHGYILSCHQRGEVVDVSLSLVKLMLDAGAEVNHKNVYGCSPIQLAVLTGNLALVKMLLDAGADINSQNVIGVSALHHAVLTNDDAMVFLLLARGASVALKTRAGDTALHWAFACSGYTRSHMIMKLLDYGSDVNARNLRGLTFLELGIQLSQHGLCCMICMYIAELEAKKDEQLFDERSLAFIKGRPDIRKHYEKNQSILADMKRRKIGNSLISYLSVLTEPQDVVDRYARNEDFVKEFKAGYYQTNYSRYKFRLKAKFTEAIARREMIDEASVILSETLQFADPSHPAFEIITQYLTKYDLEILITGARAES